MPRAHGKTTGPLTTTEAPLTPPGPQETWNTAARCSRVPSGPPSGGGRSVETTRRPRAESGRWHRWAGALLSLREAGPTLVAMAGRERSGPTAPGSPRGSAPWPPGLKDGAGRGCRGGGDGDGRPRWTRLGVGLPTQHGPRGTCGTGQLLRMVPVAPGRAARPDRCQLGPHFLWRRAEGGWSCCWGPRRPAGHRQLIPGTPAAPTAQGGC